MEAETTTTVRRATCADLPAMVELLSILFTQEADFSPEPAKQERALRLILESPAVGTLFVACQGETVVGMVSMLWTVSTAEGGRACWLEDFVVHPACRGGGTGSRLVTEAVRQVQAEGCARVAVLTDRANAGALRLYERLGFRASDMRCLRLPLGPPGDKD